MARIQKGFALSAAIIGTLCLIFGVATSICAWVLSSKADFSFETNDSDYSTSSKTFGTYWWGGIGFAVPGILGIVAGCTRNTVAMVFFLIFNLICIICAMVVSVMVALLVLLWAVADNLYTNGYCSDIAGICHCEDSQTSYDIRTACSNIAGVQGILIAIVAMSSISSLLAFIASYISCCALCNQEHDRGTIIIQPGPGAYQPPAMIISHGNTTMVGGGYPQGPYQPGTYHQGAYTAQMPPAYSQPQTQVHDKANLVKNEVI